MTRAPEPAWTPERPYVSGRCSIGTHGVCQDAEPRESGFTGLRYLVCTCCCHRLGPIPANGVSS